MTEDPLAEALRIVPHRCRLADAHISEVVAQTARATAGITEQLSRIVSLAGSVAGDVRRFSGAFDRSRRARPDDSAMMARLSGYLHARDAQVRMLTEEVRALFTHVEAIEIIDGAVHDLAQTVMAALIRPGGTGHGVAEIADGVARLADRSAAAAHTIRTSVLDTGTCIEETLAEHVAGDHPPHEQAMLAGLLETAAAGQRARSRLATELLAELATAAQRTPSRPRRPRPGGPRPRRP